MKINVGPQDRKVSDKELIDLTFVGVKYKVRKIKTAVAMDLGLIMEDEDSKPEAKLEAINTLIDKIFRDDGDSIRERLKDSDDQLDFPHIAELMQAMMDTEENPTGSPTD